MCASTSSVVRHASALGSSFAELDAVVRLDLVLGLLVL